MVISLETLNELGFVDEMYARGANLKLLASRELISRHLAYWCRQRQMLRSEAMLDFVNNVIDGLRSALK